MRQCDFLLTYEVRNREIENLCLLKYELERRGYSVAFAEQYAAFFGRPEPFDAKVVVVPAYYRERSRFYTSSHAARVEKVVNLQWEQVYSKSKDSKDSVLSIKPWGFDATHISWGEDNARRLIDEYGVPEERVAITGHIALDFLRPQLRGYYLSREELCERFSLSPDRKLLLLISSFSKTTLPDRVIAAACKTEEEKESMLKACKTMAETQRMIFGWIGELLNRKDDVTVVYRPHPEEGESELVRQFAADHSNFRSIGELSIRQWILVSDVICTVASTSVSEVFFSGKSCLVLRPLPLPDEYSTRLYDQASTVEDVESFIEQVASPDVPFPIREEAIRSIYSVDGQKPSFELICDAFERVLHDDRLVLDTPLRNPFKGLVNGERIACFIKRRVAKSRVCRAIHDRDLLRDSEFRKALDDVLYVKRKLKKNHVSDTEIDEIESRIAAALAKGDA